MCSWRRVWWDAVVVSAEEADVLACYYAQRQNYRCWSSIRVVEGCGGTSRTGVVGAVVLVAARSHWWGCDCVGSSVALETDQLATHTGIITATWTGIWTSEGCTTTRYTVVAAAVVLAGPIEVGARRAAGGSGPEHCGVATHTALLTLLLTLAAGAAAVGSAGAGAFVWLNLRLICAGCGCLWW